MPGEFQESKSVMGYMPVKESVDVTDPCYDRDVWCRMNTVKVLPGDYECSYFEANFPCEYDGEIEDDYRVTRARIVHKDYVNAVKDDSFLKEIGEIGVDAGLAGFFDNKPDFDGEAWHEFCHMMSRDKKAYLTDLGFWAESGYGDGGYPVYAMSNEDGVIVGLEIAFIWTWDDDAEEEEDEQD